MEQDKFTDTLKTILQWEMLLQITFKTFALSMCLDPWSGGFKNYYVSNTFDGITTPQVSISLSNLV
jgi:hypothetical protein